MTCDIYSQEVIFKLELHSCFHSLTLSRAHSPLPSFLHSSIIPGFRVLKFRKKGGKENSEQGGADQGHLESWQNMSRMTRAGRPFVKARWSSSPASLSSLSHCPQHQDRFTVLFLRLWPLSCLPCSGKCQDHRFC